MRPARGHARAFADLRELVDPGERVGPVTAAPLAVPDAWELVGERWIEQMVSRALPAHGRRSDDRSSSAPRTAEQMAALAALTSPGRWAPRTL